MASDYKVAPPKLASHQEGKTESKRLKALQNSPMYFRYWHFTETKSRLCLSPGGADSNETWRIDLTVC